MTTHSLTLVVNQRIGDDDIDNLFEHADDATPEREHDRTLVHFAREAPSWPAAVVSALTDLEAAGFPAASVRTDAALTSGCEPVDLTPRATRPCPAGSPESRQGRQDRP